MKKILLCVVCFMHFVMFGFTQETVENPKDPPGKNVDRIVTLEEVMQINDVGEDFYFKYPHNLRVASDGVLFVQDQEQFIQFDPKGKFIRNLFQKGQGPGEMQSAGHYFFAGENIIVHERWTDKMIVFDFDGKLLKDFKIQEKVSLFRFLLFWKDNYYFLSSERPVVEKTSVVDIHQKMVEISQEGKEIKEKIEIPTTGFIAVGKQGGRVFYDISSVITVSYGEKFLFFSHTQEYLLKLYNAEKNQVVRIFKRDYPRVKKPPDAEKTGGAMLDGKPVSPPPQKYLNDIQNLLVFRDSLWVVTSTVSENKGTLIDVFDTYGRYIDRFYLKFPGNMVRGYHSDTAVDIWEDFLFTIEQDEDGTYAIGKYKMIDKN